MAACSVSHEAGQVVLKANLNKPGVYILYRDDEPYYIGKTGKPLIKRLNNQLQAHPTEMK